MGITLQSFESQEEYFLIRLHIYDHENNENGIMKNVRHPRSILYGCYRHKQLG